ncbi:hypothetical protein NM688_g6819 [Phlebia brevispora]|uniref:Uncharacterized protein n=1 Tax=Phlebia brevispora TaxID=194682 RepID=A0ACC1SC28_9APHY|nr:hypothetical protein NM688_g6819 [Phlebia brevispora]
MSADLDTAGVIAEFQSNVLDNRINYAFSALAFYEYVITLRYEWDCLSAPKWGIGTWIFLVNRYLMLATVVQTIAPYSRADTDIHFNAIAQYIVTAAFSAIRVHTLLQNNRRLVSWAIFLLGLIPAIVNFVSRGSACYQIEHVPLAHIPDQYFCSFLYFTYADDPILGPTCNAFMSDGIPPSVDLARDRSALVIVDVVVILVTWRNIYRVRHLRMFTLGMVFKRDGSIIFSVLLVLNIVLFVNDLVVGDNGSPSWALSDGLTIINAVIQFILISRFFIDIREQEHESHKSFGEPQEMSTLVYQGGKIAQEEPSELTSQSRTDDNSEGIQETVSSTPLFSSAALFADKN